MKLSNLFLQSPVINTNDTTIVHLNAILDGGSNATLIREDAVHILKLQGKNKKFKVRKAPRNSQVLNKK